MDFRELRAWQREAAIQQRNTLLRLSRGVRLGNTDASSYERAVNELYRETAVDRGVVTRETIAKNVRDELKQMSKEQEKKQKRKRKG